MSVTIYDIAREAGVDAGAVSRTLRDDPQSLRLRSETRQRIKEIAARLGYQRNLHAASIRTGRVDTIALIASPDISPENYSILITGLVRSASESGFGIRIFMDGDLNAVFAAIGGNRIGHVISMHLDAAKRGEVAEFCRKQGLVLTFLFERPLSGYPCVRTDNRKGARMAVEHLLKLGHRRIALACAPHRWFYQRDRHDGYLDAMNACGLEVSELWLGCSDNLEDHFDRMMRLPLRKRPTAFFALSDRQALRLENRAIRAGLSVPSDLALCGFGNSMIGAEALVPLTSVEEHFDQQAETAIRLLLGEKTGEIPASGDVSIEPCLVVRDSSGKNILP